MRKRYGWPIACLIVFVGAATALSPRGREEPGVEFAAPREVTSWPGAVPNADKLRALSLRRALVWWPSDPAAVDLAANPPDPGGALSAPIVRCRFLSKAANGTTPKFDCVLPDGEIVSTSSADTIHWR